jgi:NADH-quinone oxidoreductase subunit A
MTLVDYLPVLVQLILAIVMAVGILGASHLFGQRARKNKIKDSAYECGLIAEGKPHTRFSVKFYVTAMLFIIFDVEIVFLIPWAIVYREFLAAGIPILTPVLFFLSVLVIGLIYEIRKGALQWER